MPKPASIKTLPDAAAWIHEHDGRIEAWWREQHRYNHDERTRSDNAFARNKAEIVALKKQVMSLERRATYLAGFASAIGAIAGAVVGAWIKSAMSGQ